MRFAVLAYFSIATSCSPVDVQRDEGNSSQAQNHVPVIRRPALSVQKEVSDLLTKSDVFLITPNTLVEHLKPIVELSLIQQDVYSKIYIGSSHKRGVLWTKAEFQKAPIGTPNTWELLFIRFALLPEVDSGQSTFSQLSEALSSIVGKPVYTDIKDSIIIWQLKAHNELILRETKLPNPLDGKMKLVVILEAAVTQGEEEN
jgi:hypothetical protein